jgi:glycosyltransferase involved in cell wall biosynthesis
VHTLRNYNLLCHRRMLQDKRPCQRQCPRCRTPRLANRSAGNLLDAVIGISPHVLQVHLDAGWFGKVRHRAVVANSYDPPAGEGAGGAGSAGGRSFDIGYIGRLHATKGIEELISAVVTLRRGGLRVRLLVAGTGNQEYEAYLRGLDPDPDTVFAGFLDKTEFFNRVRFCVVPSVWFEPFGRVFIEALHHGVPVIGSDRCGGSDVITPGLNGLIAEPSTEGLVDAIRTALVLPDVAVDAMRDAAFAAAPRYSSRVIAARYAEIYRNALVG